MPDFTVNIESAAVAANVQTANVSALIASASVAVDIESANVSANIETANISVNINGPSAGGGSSLGDLPTYIDDAAAISGGLAVGDFYIVDAGNDAIQQGLIKKIL